jgi:hypothetical protein
MIWLSPFPEFPSSPLSVSKLDWRHTGRLRKRDNLLTGEGVGAVEEPNQTTLYIIQHSLGQTQNLPSWERINATPIILCQTTQNKADLWENIIIIAGGYTLFTMYVNFTVVCLWGCMVNSFLVNLITHYWFLCVNLKSITYTLYK